MRKKILIAYVGISVLGWSWFLVSYFTPIDRAPEFPINYLAEKQLTIFSSDWEYSAPTIPTDRNITFAKYVYVTYFHTADPRRYVWVNVHMHGNPLQARLDDCPSYSCIGILYSEGEKYTTPEGWTYHPPHADSFIIRCKDYQSDNISGCGIIVRYGEMIVEIDPSLKAALTAHDLQLLLEVTDETIYNYFEQSTINPKSRWLIGF